jgi:hypothetical protein
MHRELELGRVTWRLVPPKKLKALRRKRDVN